MEQYENYLKTMFEYIKNSNDTSKIEEVLMYLAQYIYFQCELDKLLVNNINSVVNAVFKKEMGDLITTGLRLIKQNALEFDFEKTKNYTLQLKRIIKERYNKYLSDRQNVYCLDNKIYSLGYVWEEEKWIKE